MLLGVLEHPVGDQRTYYLSAGRVECKNMCFMSLLRRNCLWCIAMETRNLSSTINISRAIQSLVDHLCRSRIPKATIHHLVRLVFSFSLYSMVNNVVLGRAFPTI